MTEQQPYEVVERFDGVELRRYPAHAVAEVAVGGSFEGAGSEAFGALFGYISGRNRSATSVAMTAPVVQTEPVVQAGPPEKVAMTAPVLQTGAAGGHVVAFVLPAAITAETAPVPTDPRVRVRAVPERLSLAARYTGRWTEPSYRRHLAELEAAATAAGLVPVGTPRFARFDPPITPWFLRRNEVVLDVLEPPSAASEPPRADP